MEKAILTLPMMPVNGNNYGKFVTPIICETLRNILGGNYYQCINILDSFNDRSIYLKKYIESLDTNKICYDNLWIDSENVSKLLNNIVILIKKGYIFEKYTTIYRCECGVVEIEKDKINTCNPSNLKFYEKNGTYICKCCGNVCKESKEKILAFTPFNIKLDDIEIFPRYLNKDIKTYEQTVLNSYTTISRKRNTGISINYNGTKYNIDIDFLWGTYLNTFSEKEKILVSGNRMLYQLFLVRVLEKCLAKENKTIIIGTPYLTNIKEILNNLYFIDDNILRKLFIIFNTKWQKKEILYDESTLKYLNKLSLSKRKELYDIINMRVLFDYDLLNLEKVLKEKFNMQESVKKLKLERR